MNYTSIDRLCDFEFHDAEFVLDSLDNNRLAVRVRYLNIHKNAAQNPFETDMEIDHAHITFEGLTVISYEPGRVWKQDENGKLYSNESRVILSDEEAFGRFSTQLETGITIFDFDIKEGKTYFIDGMGADPFFTVCFTFSRVVITWDGYKKEAWYSSRNE